MPSRRYERRVWSAKRKARSELQDSPSLWVACGYAKTFDLSLNSVQDRCPRVDAKTLRTDEFVVNYERPYKPVVIINDQEGWRAQRKWTMEVWSCSNFAS